MGKAQYLDGVNANVDKFIAIPGWFRLATKVVLVVASHLKRFDCPCGGGAIEACVLTVPRV